MKNIALLFLLLTVGCATTITAVGKDVKLTKIPAANNCEEIGGVEGGGYGHIKAISAKNDIRNKAAKMGANYVVLEAIMCCDYRVVGTAYKCP